MLVAVSAAHNRHALTRAWAEHTESLGFDGVYVAVTDGDYKNHTLSTIRSTFHPIFTPNAPLAGKFNAALQYAIRYGATRIMILPSDDFASPAWVKTARESEEDYMISHTLAVVDSATQAAYKITKLSLTPGATMKYGAGRVISRKVVEKLGGQLWPSELNKGLDSASHAAISKAGFTVKVVETEGIPITDVKTSENLWPFQTWIGSGKHCTADEALHMVSPSVRSQIDALRQ